METQKEIAAATEMVAGTRKIVGSESRLLQRDITPVSADRRYINWVGFFLMWAGMSILLSTFLMGGLGMHSLTLFQTILAIVLANALIAVVLFLVGDIGIEHGIPFAVYMRAPFGIYGTYIPTIIRAVIAASWFGIQSYLGSLAINGIIKYFTGFDNFLVWFLVFVGLQLWNCARGINAIKKFDAFAVPIILIISVWMLLRMIGLAGAKGIDLATFKGSGTGTFWTVVVANMGYWATMAIDISDITRFVQTKKGERNYWRRNFHNILGQALGMPPVMGLIALIGAIAFVATGNWNPVEVIQSTAQGIVLVILLLMVVFAQWTTNTAANLVPPAMVFVNAGAPRITYSVGVLIAGAIGVLIQPWKVLDFLFTFLDYVGSFLAPVAAIIIVDYYIIRRRRLNVPDLYRADGQYRFVGGWNPAGYIALIAGGIAAISNLKYGYPTGFVVTFVVYYLLAKFWVYKQYPQKEIESKHSDQYLATTVGKDWPIETKEKSFLDIY
ncbi:MAG: NCS1 family transporter [Firmicutes bacterium]|nr:NCS1 family transporter [Bacillota bacterium]